MTLEPSLQTAHDKSSTYAPPQYDIQTYPADYTLQVLHEKYMDGELVIPPIQRNHVWQWDQASRLIESFLLGLPVPPIFIYWRPDEKYLVIDGQQRLKSVVQYMQNRFDNDSPQGGRPFRLSLDHASKFHGKTFLELMPEDRRRLQNAVLRSVVIRQIHPSNDDTSMHHIFERLNTGGTPLKEQEVRNCIYAGGLNDMLHELNEYKNWRKILGKPRKDQRKKDVEYILRYISLFHGSSGYKQPMKDFLSKYMKANRDPDGGFLEDEKTRFKTTCDLIVAKIGPKPFSPNGKFSVSRFDAIFVAFAKNVPDCPDDIGKRFTKLQEDDKFQEYTGVASTDSDTVKKRLKLAEKLLFG